jgi:DNA uptake protein ComE-like DNA-binding protein
MAGRLQSVLSLNTVDTEDRDLLVEKLTHRLSSLEKLTATLLLENAGLREENAALHPNNVTSVLELNPELVADMTSMIEDSMNEVMKTHDVQHEFMKTMVETNNADKYNNMELSGVGGAMAQLMENEDGSRMISLMSGDLISLRHDGE